MLTSMTGYGRAQANILNKDITIEIKSVNHRFFDFNSRVPRIYGFLDEKLKSYLQKYINRGKIDVFVLIVNSDSDAVEVSLDRSLLSGYLKSLRAMQKEHNLIDDISVSTIARYNDIFVVKKNEEIAETLWEAVKIVTDLALEGYLNMKKIEGEKLKTGMLSSCNEIEKIVAGIEERSPISVAEYRKKIEERMKELLADTNIDENRILIETAIFADKISVNEEIVRLNSHISQFKTLLNTKDAIGIDN